MCMLAGCELVFQLLQIEDGLGFCLLIHGLHRRRFFSIAAGAVG